MIPEYRPLDNIDSQHNELHRKVFRFGLSILPDITATVPTTTTLQTGVAQIYISGTTYRVYININNVIYYWTLTAA